MHYHRWQRFGDPMTIKTAERGTATKDGYRVYGEILEHRVVAERAFGKPLPSNAIVHHWDENRSNNVNDNLLICNRAYHKVIHGRMNAHKACGNANWRLCLYCKQYDDPKNLYAKHTSAYHNSCRREAVKRRKQAHALR